MAEKLPLLVFPQARKIVPTPGRGFPQGRPHLPSLVRQIDRLSGQIDDVQEDFSKYKANLSNVVAGFEPELVLVIRIAGRVDDFKQALESTKGLEWLGEWDLEDIEPDDDFYVNPKIGVDFFRNSISGDVTREQSKEIQNILLEKGLIDNNEMMVAEQIGELSLPEHLSHLRQEIIQAIDQAKRARSLNGRLFLSMTNQQGLNELLGLWRRWSNGERMPRGKAKWRDLFNHIIEIRRWGLEETLQETGMIDHWRELLDPLDPSQEIHCQIELFYSRDKGKRRQYEDAVTRLLEDINGEYLGSTGFIDMEDIAFHAVKVKLPIKSVKSLIDALEASANEIEIDLFIFPGIMYFRPTGQSLVVLDDDEGEVVNLPLSQPESPPVAAILDGVPNIQHIALANRLLLDDPDNLSGEYQLGERKHGTTMASLVVHGDLVPGQDSSLTRKVYHAPIMQPNPNDRDSKEHFPVDVFFEDRVERAVRRMFEGDGRVPAQAQDVKVINLSIGDPDRPFTHIPSPIARLLDWLSWKYRVLFCVSTGNFMDGFDLGISDAAFMKKTDEEKITHVLKCIENQLSQRRLLAPAESLNSLTVGALHADESGDYESRNRIDLLPSPKLFSPISRVGHGFRRSVKPEILFPGGRQLYDDFSINGKHRLNSTLQAPGQKVAWDSNVEGDKSKSVHTRGTSNATALATRGGARIYEVLAELQEEHGEQVNDGLIAVLIKTLLVHGAKHPEQGKLHLEEALRDSGNSRRIKEVVSRYMGYGAVDIERVLACTEQRATALGSDEIRENEVHEYHFPLPTALSGSREWRRIVVTLAWFTPINPEHRNLREAKLELSPSSKWDQVPLRIKREDSDHNQVQRGTVQHEVLEGTRKILEFHDDEAILLQVRCKKDATESLDQTIPYGLAVTLEVEEGVNIPIYQQIREKIKPQIPVTTPG